MTTQHTTTTPTQDIALTQSDAPAQPATLPRSLAQTLHDTGYGALERWINSAECVPGEIRALWAGVTTMACNLRGDGGYSAAELQRALSAIARGFEFVTCQHGPVHWEITNPSEVGYANKP